LFNIIFLVCVKRFVFNSFAAYCMQHSNDVVSDRYIVALLSFSEGAGSLDTPKLKTLLLASTLDLRSGFETQIFSTLSTNPSFIFSFEKQTAYELLLSLTVSPCRGFSITVNPEGILGRDLAAKCESTKETMKVQTIILSGASNLGKLKPTIFEAPRQDGCLLEKNFQPYGL
jgi:hypothetical protein